MTNASKTNVGWLPVVLVILAASGCSQAPGGNTEGGDVAAVNVTAVAVQPSVLRPSLELVGNLIAPPEKTAILSPQVAGYVSAVPVVEGQAVRAGETIVVLDPRLVESELNKAAAAAEEARANLALLEKGPLPAEVEAARQDMRNAAAAAGARVAKLKALEALQKHGEIADVQLAQAQSSADGADAARSAAAERLKMLESGTRPELIEQAAAQLHLAESERDAWALKKTLCNVAAPIDGHVTQLPVRQGMYVDVLANVATIQDLSALYARVRVPATHLAQLTQGATAQVAVAGDSGPPREATVRRIGAEADANTGDVEVLAEVQNAGGALRPGLGCRVSLALAEIPDALAVPPAAVTDRNGEAVVTVVEDGKAYQRTVRTGVQTADAIQIVEGLAPGATVVTLGGYALPDGCPVRVAEDGG